MKSLINMVFEHYGNELLLMIPALSRQRCSQPPHVYQQLEFFMDRLIDLAGGAAMNVVANHMEKKYHNCVFLRRMINNSERRSLKYSEPNARRQQRERNWAEERLPLACFFPGSDPEMSEQRFMGAGSLTSTTVEAL